MNPRIDVSTILHRWELQVLLTTIGTTNPKGNKGSNMLEMFSEKIYFLTLESNMVTNSKRLSSLDILQID